MRLYEAKQKDICEAQTQDHEEASVCRKERSRGRVDIPHGSKCKAKFENYRETNRAGRRDDVERQISLTATNAKLRLDNTKRQTVKKGEITWVDRSPTQQYECPLNMRRAAYCLVKT